MPTWETRLKTCSLSIPCNKPQGKEHLLLEEIVKALQKGKCVLVLGSQTASSCPQQYPASEAAQTVLRW